MQESRQDMTAADVEAIEKEIAAYLCAHPDFLARHPGVLEALVPPEAAHGGNVKDFQHFAIRKLQDRVRQAKEKFDGLVVSARDNHSVRKQVEEAALALVRAPTMERLLESLTVDLAALFAVDVVRLALESAAAEAYGVEDRLDSGLVLVAPGTAAAAMGRGRKRVRLVADAAKEKVSCFADIFAECEDLAQSCALLRLDLGEEGREALLAFGVREMGRFHASQGDDLLRFLARVLELRLAACLRDSGWEDAGG